jgi:hypothetical protein
MPSTPDLIYGLRHTILKKVLVAEWIGVKHGQYILNDRVISIELLALCI